MSVLNHTVFELLLILFATGSVIIGLLISFQAYRGLRRNGDKQMLYLSIGMVLLFGASYALAFATTVLLEFRVVPLLYQNVLRLLVRILQLAGLVCIAYSMYAD